MKPIWIVRLCLLGAAALVALVWLRVWYVEQRVQVMLFNATNGQSLFNR